MSPENLFLFPRLLSHLFLSSWPSSLSLFLPTPATLAMLLPSSLTVLLSYFRAKLLFYRYVVVFNVQMIYPYIFLQTESMHISRCIDHVRNQNLKK